MKRSIVICSLDVRPCALVGGVGNTKQYTTLSPSECVNTPSGTITTIVQLRLNHKTTNQFLFNLLKLILAPVSTAWISREYLLDVTGATNVLVEDVESKTTSSVSRDNLILDLLK